MCKITGVTDTPSQMKLSESPRKKAEIGQIRASLSAVRYANIISKELPLETKRIIRSKIVDLQLFEGFPADAG